MKKIWRVIVGVIFIIGGFGSLSTNVSAGIFVVLLGAVLITWHIILKKKTKSKIITSTFSDNKSRFTSAFDTRSVSEIITETNANISAKYDFFTFKIAGVTFKNGRKTRHAILRKIKYRDDPFNHSVNLTISKYDFEGEPALGVYANDEQIGNVPKDKISYVLDNWSRFDAITAINVYGGGTTDEGEHRNYGAEITLRYNKF